MLILKRRQNKVNMISTFIYVIASTDFYLNHFPTYRLYKSYTTMDLYLHSNTFEEANTIEKVVKNNKIFDSI